MDLVYVLIQYIVNNVIQNKYNFAKRLTEGGYFLRGLPVPIKIQRALKGVLSSNSKA